MIFTIYFLYYLFIIYANINTRKYLKKVYEPKIKTTGTEQPSQIS